MTQPRPWPFMVTPATTAQPEEEQDCHCQACMPFDYTKPETVRMIVCAICGNKRCPHATDHRNACTNSNDSGQPGSAYGPPAGNAPCADTYAGCPPECGPHNRCRPAGVKDAP